MNDETLEALRQVDGDVDLIEHETLEEFWEALGFNMSWTSVKEKDKLPESLDEIIFTDGKGIYKGYRYAAYVNSNQEVERWYSITDTRIEDVTHWMPLPELPND